MWNLLLIGWAAAAPAQDLVIAADRLFDGRRSLDQAYVVEVRDGRVTAVHPGPAPSGALYLPGAVLTPGLIDAYSYMGVDAASAEESRESTPSLKVAAGADLGAAAFRRAAAEGVTAAYLSPDSLNVLSGLGAVVKTSGGRPADLFAPPFSAARVLNDGAALKITIGGDPSDSNYPPRGGPPSDLRGRRPTTRMGVVWIIRQEFYRAKRYREERAAGTAALDPDLEVLVAALDGRVPVRVQARRSHDVQTALRLQQEFGWPRLIVEEGSEAHLVADLLAKAKVPVAAGPAYATSWQAIVSGPTAAELRELAQPSPVCCEEDDGALFAGSEHQHDDAIPLPEDDHEHVRLDGAVLDLLLAALRPAQASGLYGRFGESDEATPALAALLARAGVLTALGAAEGHDSPATEGSVIHQARQAVKFGLDPELALRMVTADAAAVCGVAQEIGAVESGKQADLVLWSGPPLQADSRPLLVIIDGRVVVDRRPPSPD